MVHLSKEDTKELGKKCACDMCGSKDGENVIDPYYQDVYQEEILVSLCDKCYWASVGDI